MAMSVDLLLEFTGLASLGQAAYLGVYLTAILATKYQFGLGWSFWLMIVFGVLIGTARVALFGLKARHRALKHRLQSRFHPVRPQPWRSRL